MCMRKFVYLILPKKITEKILGMIFAVLLHFLLLVPVDHVIPLFPVPNILISSGFYNNPKDHSTVGTESH